MTTISKMLRYASSGAAVMGLAAGLGVVSTPTWADSCGTSGIELSDLLMSGASITCGVKTYSGFNYNGPTDASTIGVVANESSLGGGKLSDTLTFDGSFLSLAGHSNDWNIGYTVTAAPGWSITGTDLSAVLLDGGTGGGSNITDSFYKNGVLVGSLILNNPGGTVNGDISPGLSSITVNKDIFAAGGTGIAGTSNIVQSLVDTQGVPEIDAASGTGAIGLLLGAMALAGERRRRRAA